MEAFMQRRQRDNAEYRQKLANSGRPADVWHRTADTWFDGSIESVDRRLAACNHLLSASEKAVAEEGFSARHLAAISELQQSQGALEGLRRKLLTAASDYEEPILAPATADPHLARQDRRWVALEGAKFFRSHSDVPMDELQIRARNFAELKTSTLTQKRSQAIASAFVHRVAQLRRETPRPRVASAPPVVDAPPEMMFM